jgi:hypothetical protein
VIATALAVLVATGIGACALLVDAEGLSNGRSETADSALPSDTGPGPAGDSGAQDACADASAPGCVGRDLPRDGLAVWFRADDGVVASAAGALATWKDSAPQLHPGRLGMDAKGLGNGVTFEGGAVAFDGGGALELPPGFTDLTRGVSIFLALWPALDPGGSAGPVLGLGYPSPDECARQPELSIDGFGLHYRVENEMVSGDAVVDGRGWDILSVVHEGWGGQLACPDQARLTIRHGSEVIAEQPARTLTKGVRSRGRIGQSVYYPSQFFEGKVAEILIYERALAASEVTQVSDYLLRRWPRP